MPTTGVAAVVLNVTVSQPAAAGFVTVYPDNSVRRLSSNVNFSAGGTVPNLVVAPVGSDGKVDLLNGSEGTIQLIADVSGYFTGVSSPTVGAFNSLMPGRVLDTRNGTGAAQAAVSPGNTVKLTVDGQGGLPATGLRAVVLNVTVTQAASSGYVTAFADGTSRPVASNLNFVAGETVPNLVIAPVGTDGKVDLYNGSTGSVELIADVSGFFGVGLAETLGGVVSLVADGGEFGQSFCALLSSGGVDCWGNNDEGELGNGMGRLGGVSNFSDTPVAVSGVGGAGTLGGVVSLVGGGDSFCALLSSGGVVCWGFDGVGELGDGNFTGPVTCEGPCSDVPEPVVDVGGSGALGAVASLYGPTNSGPVADWYCAVLTSGDAVCWGEQANYPLDTATPVVVPDVDGSGALAGVSKIVGGLMDICALLGSGGVDCWGFDYDNSNPDTPVPVPDLSNAGTLGAVNDVALSEYQDSAAFCATLTSGGVDCWGVNNDGVLGDGAASSSTFVEVPVQVASDDGTGALSGVSSVTTGTFSDFCAVLSAGGR